MTDPEQPPTEPVLNAGALAGALSGAVATVGMVLVGTGWLTKGQVDTAAHIVQLVVFAAVTVIAGLSPYLAAWHARKKVTPLTAPRDYDGVALVRDDAPVQPAPPAEPAPAPRGPDTAAFKAQLDHDYEQWRAACFPDHT